VPWGERGSPERASNPYQEESGTYLEYRTLWAMTDKLNWLKEYNNRQGVWHLNMDAGEFTSLDFIVPNKYSNATESKKIQVQITYHGSSDAPREKILILLKQKNEEYIHLLPSSDYQSGLMPEGWVQHTFVFKTDFVRLPKMFKYFHQKTGIFISTM